MMMDGDLLHLLWSLGETLGPRSQVVAEAIRKAREGELSPKAALRVVWEIVQKDADLFGAAETCLLEGFGLKVSTALARLPAREAALEQWGFTDEDLIYQPDPDRPTKMLHPLLMGAICELLQFDGDVPELRTGVLPEGGTPAVPVHTTSRDPVVVGTMLRTASSEVAGMLAEAQREHDAKVADLAEVMDGFDDMSRAMVRREATRAVAVPGYVPGHRAEMRTVAPPAMVEVSALSFEDRQRLAHLALTSTQGRRSIAPVLETLVLEGLHEDGFAGIKRGRSEGAVVATEEWRIQINGGALDRNPRFNFIDVAARTLRLKLRRALGAPAESSTWWVHVSLISDISDREVGWRAVVCSG